MPRIGQNPMKWLSEDRPPNTITITTIVHIPKLEDYWSESLDVLKLCLHSLHKTTSQPFDLMVLDNGSCPEVQDYLLTLNRQGTIQYLILSKQNIGKVGAWNFLFSSAPGKVIVYTDSDVFFLKGWLKDSLQILKNFPEAGMVTAQPARRNYLHCSSTLEAIKNNSSVKVNEGDLLSEAYIRACRIGLGLPTEQYEERIVGQKDILLRRNGTGAYVSADHFQFLTTRSVLQHLLPFQVTDKLVGMDEYQIDAGINNAGYWRLSTESFLVHHMGNHLPDFQDELPWLSKTDLPNPGAFSQPIRQSNHTYDIWQNRHIRRYLKRLNSLTYRLLYKS